MKEQLIRIAEEKGFVHTKDNFYVWMCELSKWLRENYEINVFCLQITHEDSTGFWESNMQTDLLNDDEENGIDESDDEWVFRTYDQAFQDGLLDALRILERYAK